MYIKVIKKILHVLVRRRPYAVLPSSLSADVRLRNASGGRAVDTTQ